MENILTSAIVAAAVAGVLAYLKKSAAKKIDTNEQGQYQLRMHALYNIVGWLSLIICCGIVIGAFLTEERDVFMYVLVPSMLLLFGGLGLLSVLYYRNYYVLFNDSRIEVRDVRGKVKISGWKQIVAARFNGFSGFLILTDTEGQKLKIHYQSVGISQFIALLEEKTEWTAKKLKLPVERNNLA